jgi:hypothetical protein
MAAPGEGGRVYERGLVDALKVFGYVPQNYQPAESDDTRPDIEMTVNGISAGIEVKLDSKAAFGSGTIDFDYVRFAAGRDPWVYGGKGAKAGQLIEEMAKKEKLLETINEKWYKNNSVIKEYVPYKIENQRYLKNVKLPSKKDQYTKDQQSLPEIKIDIPTQYISTYYVSKDSPYLQTGDCGLCILGNVDPLKLTSKGVPKFRPQGAYFRVRVQPKGSGNYRFAYEMYVKGLNKSPFSLGAAGSGGRVTSADLNFLR